MTYTNPDVDPYPDAQTPAEWLEAAFADGWLERHSSLSHRGYMANIREDHRADTCDELCRRAVDSARWPSDPASNRYLGSRATGSELFQQLMSEELPTLSPLPVERLTA